jgi:hypothetical protein
MKEKLYLGRLLGRREAFGAMAGRCAAADVAQLREIRDKKLYLEDYANWEEFCGEEAHMTKAKANRLIRYLDEFGPNYFVLAQLTQVSPTTYRALAPSIEDEKLHYEGEAIALIPENAQKVASAVAEIRKTVTVKAVEAPLAGPAVPPEDPILVLERECSAVAEMLEKAIPTLRHRSAYMRAVVCGLRDRLVRMEMTI